MKPDGIFKIINIATCHCLWILGEERHSCVVNI